MTVLAVHKFEDSGTHHKILLDSVTPSTLWPQSSTLIGALKDAICHTKFETDDDDDDVICTVGTLLSEQDKAWY